MSIGTVERIITALGAIVDVTVRWEGVELDRSLDAAHARLQDWVAQELTQLGWLVRVEVSFNHFGDRGRVDILAYHPSTRILLIVEVKSALGDLQDTLGRLDVKVRLGPTLAREAGWTDCEHVVPLLAVTDARSARHVVGAHAALFERYRLRGRQAVAWLRRPAVPVPPGLLWFVNVPHSHGMPSTRGTRVRTVNSRG